MEVADKKLTDEEYDLSMLNGYFYLIHKETTKQAFTRNASTVIYYPFDSNNIKRSDIEIMIKHFASYKLQEYERCNELQKILKNYI